MQETGINMRVGAVTLQYVDGRGYYSPYHGHTKNPIKAQKWAEQIHNDRIVPEPITLLKPKRVKADRYATRNHGRNGGRKAKPVRPYTQDERDYILRHMAKRGVSHFAKHFGRTYRDVFNFMQSLTESAKNGRSEGNQKATSR